MKKYLTAFNDAGSFVFTGGLDGADLGAAHPAVEEALGLAEASADLTALEAVPRIRWSRVAVWGAGTGNE